MAKIVYDEYYKEKKYFGAPYKGLVEFFEQYNPKGTVLDLGCGQGRDAIPIAIMGYDVIAVDHSKTGINDLKKNAQSLGININAVVGDVYNIKIDETIDIVLLDSMLHFYKNDIKKESEFIKNILKDLKEDGVFINFQVKGKAREEILKLIIEQSEYDFEVLTEKYVDYPETASKFHMLAVKKNNSNQQ